MPRRPRAECEIGIYHVTARGNRQEPIYVDDRDRARYVASLARVTGRMRWHCLAYCLMGNHVHLLVETRTPNLGAGMHRLQGSYAQYFNIRHGHSGHLFEDRYHHVRIRSDPHLWLAAAYIANNPVKAGLCRKPLDWPWSSHAITVGGRSPNWLASRRLLSYFEGQGGDPQDLLVELVEAFAHKPKGDSPL
jgi:REP element-mobilizing transposase RayT